MRFIDPKTDFAFKRIFGSEDSTIALISFINASLGLKGDRVVETVELRNPYQTRQLPVAKDSIVDVACTDKSGVRYLVEMQVEKVKGFANRMLYNLAKCYSGQLLQGEDYPRLNDVVLIAVMDFSLFEDREEWRSLFVMKDQDTNFAPFNQFRLCCLELEKFNKTESELVGMLDKWAWFLKEADGLSVRPDELGEEEFNVAFDKAEVGKLSLEEKEAYDASVQEARDKRGMIAEGEDKGLAKGIKQGRKEGRKEGREEKGKEIALQMIEKGIDVTTISECTGLTEKQVRALKSSKK